MKNTFLSLMFVICVGLGCASCLSHKEPLRTFVMVNALSGTSSEQLKDQNLPKVTVVFPIHLQKQSKMIICNRHTGELSFVSGGMWHTIPETMMEQAVAIAVAHKKYASVQVTVHDFCADTDGTFRFNGLYVCKDSSGKTIASQSFDFKTPYKSGLVACVNYAECGNALLTQLLTKMAK